MKKWLRRTAIAFLLIGLATGAMFEYDTHMGRGWLHGEAFYQRRPTSYWRVRCDDWLERFDSPELAARYIPPMIAVPILPDDGPFGSVSIIRPVPQTYWRRLVDRFRSQADILHDDWPPRPLFGFPGSEPVLEELAQEPRHKALAERALRYAKAYRDNGNTE
jgi:hypothetical protein